MRIVELVPSLDVGGAERMAALLATELVHLGHTVDLVSLYDPVDSWIERDLHGRLPVHHLSKRSGLDLRVVPRLRRVLRALRPDIIHTHLHTLKYALAAAPCSRIVHTLHNVAEHEVEAPTRAVHALAFRAGVTPVAIGTAVAQSIHRTYGIGVRYVIPNGIRVDAFRSDDGVRADVRSELGLGDEPVFLVVGRLDRQKNHALLFAALPPQCCLLVAGEGVLGHELRANAPPGVWFLGVRGDVPRLLAAADVLVLASRWEGNPLVVMEAMAASRAVVATAVGCVPELVTDATGWLVPPDDREALASALSAAAGDRVGAMRRGERGREVARARFGADTMARRYVEAFRVRLAGSG